MNIQKLRKIARSYGLSSGNENKIELIRMIQRNEGNFDCFATAYDSICDQARCMWREDCFAVSSQQLLS